MLLQRLRLPGGLYSLSARLLVLTIGFVMISEVLIYAPSIARFRVDYLGDRIAAAHLATLALEATPDNMVSDELKGELLSHARAHAVILRRPGDIRRILATDMPPKVEVSHDLREASFFDLIHDALVTLAQTHNRVLRVTDLSPRGEGVVVEVLMDEAPMRDEMILYSWRILQLSLLISFITAALVYFSLQWLMVRPLRRVVEAMMAFGGAPEDPSRVIQPARRKDEIGVVQRGLLEMELNLRSALKQQARLAALGTAVTKINHDLRNILAAARLISDRFVNSGDPQVKRLTPTLVGSIDRAVALCTQTLDYARDEPPAPARSRFDLGALIDEVGRVVKLLTEDRAEWISSLPPGLELSADRDQLFRVLVNLGRNAVEAGARRVRVTVAAENGAGIVIEVADDGPGLPTKARDKLFMPFAGSARAGGTGLGLAIARDIVRAHGGELTLAASSLSGTVFRIELPDSRIAGSRAAE